MNLIELYARLARQLAESGTDASGLVSCYLRGRAPGHDWTYVVVPFSTGSPIPVPIFFKGASSGAKVDSGHGYVSAVVDAVALQADNLDVRFQVEVNPAGLAIAGAEWEIVACVERPVVPDGTPDPQRLPVIAFGAGGTIGKVPSLTKLRAQASAKSDGKSTEITAQVETNPSRVVVAHLVEGPVEQHAGYFGTTVGYAALPQPLKDTFTVLGVDLQGTVPILGQNVPKTTVLQPVDEIYTVDTTKAATGTKLAFDSAPGKPQSKLGLNVISSWSPSERVQATAVSPGTDPAPEFRYLVAMIRQDGTESAVGNASMFVQPAPGTKVNLKVPPEPDVPAGTFQEWRLYRTRRKGGTWQTPIQLGKVAAGGTTTDTPPVDDPVGKDVPNGGTFKLTWGGAKAGPLTPDPMTLNLEVMGLDEQLPLIEGGSSWEANRLTLKDLLLGKSGSADLDAGRGLVRPGKFTLISQQKTKLDVKYVEPLSKTEVVVNSPEIPAASVPDAEAVSAQWQASLDPFAYLAWKAVGPVNATGSVLIPPATLELRHVNLKIPARTTLALRKVDEIHKKAGKMTRIGVGWRSDSAGGLAFRLGIAPSAGGPPLAVDVVAEGVPPDLGLNLLLPTAETDKGPLEVHAARYASPPAPGDAPAKEPEVNFINNDPLGRLLVRFAPAPDPLVGLMPAGPGSAVAVDLRAPHEEPTDLRVRVAGLRLFKLIKAAGEGSDIDTLVQLKDPRPFRLQLVSSKPKEDPEKTGLDWTVLHLRARHLRRLDANVGVGLGAREPDQAASDFALAVDVESDPVGGLRARLETGGTKPGARPAATQKPVVGERLSVVDVQVDRVPPGAKVSLYPTPAANPNDPESSGAMRISANLPGDPTRVIARLWGAGAGATPMIDVDGVASGKLDTVVGGEAGTYTVQSGAAGPGQATIVDASNPFNVTHVGRRIRWPGGRGRITAQTAGTLTVDVLEGAPPDPGLLKPPSTGRRAWYHIGGPSDKVGMRATAEKPVRLRVGAQLVEGGLLRGVPPSPRLHMEQLDDLVNGDQDAKTQSVTARANGIKGFALASWEATFESASFANFTLTPARLVDTDGALLPGTDGEYKRLLGPASPTEPSLVLARADKPRWTRVAAQLDSARPNKAFLVMIHHASPPKPEPETHKVRDRVAQQIRVPVVPDVLGLQIGPGVTEITAGASWGPAFLRMEPSLWLKTATSAEAGFASAHLKEVPPLLIMANGTRSPNLHNDLPDFDPDVLKSFGSVQVTNWKQPVQRIVAGGGTLMVGRMRVVAPDGPWQADGSAPWPDPGLSELKWALSDIRRLEVFPASTDPATPGEVLFYSLGQQQADDDAKAGFQADVNAGRCTAHIFKVDLGHRGRLPGRRAAPEADSWIKEIVTEIQMEDIEGQFAFGESVGFDFDPVNPLQDDETTNGHWWAVAYMELPSPFGSTEPVFQFGNGFGNFMIRNAPWNPYWA